MANSSYARRWTVGASRLPRLVNGWWLALAVWTAEHLRGDTDLHVRDGSYEIPGWGKGAIKLSKTWRLDGEAELLPEWRDRV